MHLNPLCSPVLPKLPSPAPCDPPLQDSTYVGLDPPDVVTVWLALTPANAANGALHFLPGSHQEQLPHVDTFASGNLLLKGQTIVVRVGVCFPSLLRRVT